MGKEAVPGEGGKLNHRRLRLWPYSAVAIADRVGHESINITYNYAHLFPSTQSDMADKLNQFRKGGTDNVIEEQRRA